VAAIVEKDEFLDTGGSPIKIQVVATDKPIEGVLNVMDLSPGLDTKMCGTAGECVNRLGGDQGHINSSAGSIVDKTGHDVLHFAGIDDQYIEGPTKPDGSRGATPKPGYDCSNVMTCSGGNKLKPEQVQEAKQNSSTKTCTVEDGKTTCK
jgi:hypothetical protein